MVIGNTVTIRRFRNRRHFQDLRNRTAVMRRLRDLVLRPAFRRPRRVQVRNGETVPEGRWTPTCAPTRPTRRPLCVGADCTPSVRGDGPLAQRRGPHPRRSRFAGPRDNRGPAHNAADATGVPGNREIARARPVDRTGPNRDRSPRPCGRRQSAARALRVRSWRGPSRSGARPVPSVLSGCARRGTRQGASTTT